MSTKHQFSIAEKANPATGQPFGDKYAGVFVVTRPSIAQKQEIALRDASRLNAYGKVALEHLSEGTKLLNFVFAFLSVTGEQVPEWFDADKLFDETDEEAVLKVWQEVSLWLGTFRSKGHPEKGGEAR